MQILIPVSFFLLTTTLGIALAGEGCDQMSEIAIDSGLAAERFCHGQINPEEKNQKISVLENCLAKCREALSLVDEAEKSCFNKGDAFLAEIREFRGHITNTIRTVDILKRIEQGSATEGDLLEEALRQLE
ncbi:MAG: hypothetical protein O3A59_01215 [Nitrospirae bacterium]|nr:hypothetical protein [Nitrospirota bacterium]